MDSCVTFKERATLPYSDGASSSILAQTQLHEEQRHTSEEEHYEVRYEKHTCGTGETSVHKEEGLGQLY